MYYEYWNRIHRNDFAQEGTIMAILSVLRHIKNVFERTLSDADMDREYMDIFDEQQLQEPNGGSEELQSLSQSQELAEEESVDAKEEDNSGYIHTIRGVRVPFADINHNRNTYNQERGQQPSTTSNELDLRGHELSNSEDEDNPLSQHVLDLHS